MTSLKFVGSVGHCFDILEQSGFKIHPFSNLADVISRSKIEGEPREQELSEYLCFTSRNSINYFFESFLLHRDLDMKKLLFPLLLL